MKALDIGAKVEYQDGDKWLKGTVHGVKKAEAVKGPDIVLGYLVDTGKSIDTEGQVVKKRTDVNWQPEQVEVLPENIRAVK